MIASYSQCDSKFIRNVLSIEISEIRVSRIFWVHMLHFLAQQRDIEYSSKWNYFSFKTILYFIFIASLFPSRSIICFNYLEKISTTSNNLLGKNYQNSLILLVIFKISSEDLEIYVKGHFTLKVFQWVKNARTYQLFNSCR